MMKNSQMILLGQIIRDQREALGYAQEEFAAMLEVGRSFYGRIERGETNLSVLSLLRIAEGLKMNASELLKIFESQSRRKK